MTPFFSSDVSYSQKISSLDPTKKNFFRKELDGSRRQAQVRLREISQRFFKSSYE